MSKADHFPDMVVVTWLDITSEHNGWFDLEDVHLLAHALAVTPGWVLKEDDDNLYMASALVAHKGDLQYSFDTTIPKGCVKKIVKVKTRWR